MGGARGSGVVSSADDLLEMSVVCVVRGVGGLCQMCKYMSRVGWEV